MKFFRKIVKPDREENQIREPAESAPLKIEDIIDYLGLLSGVEREVAEFYRLCARLLGDEEEFWLSVSADELAHADNIQKMTGLVARNPERYRPGHPFNAASIRTFSMYLRSVIGRMEEGGMTREEILKTAEYIESSASELHYAKIVDTDNDEYKELALRIDAETEKHQKAIERRIEKAGPPVMKSEG